MVPSEFWKFTENLYVSFPAESFESQRAIPYFMLPQPQVKLLPPAARGL